MKNFLLLLFVILFSINSYAQTNKDDDVIILADISVEGTDEASLKQQAFNTAVRQGAYQAFQKVTFAKDHYRVQKMFDSIELDKLLSKASVKEQSLKKDGNILIFDGTFEFVFSISKMQKVLQAYNIDFNDDAKPEFKLLMIPVVKQDGLVMGWYDTKLASAFYQGPDKIGDLQLVYIIPGMDMIDITKALQTSKVEAHEVIYNILKKYSASGYNLIVCDTKGGFACDSHVVAKEKHFKRLEFEGSGIYDYHHIVSELLNIVELSTLQSITTSNVEAAVEKNTVYMEFEYMELADLLKFKQLLRTSPFVGAHFVAKTSLNSSIFKVIVLDRPQLLIEWLRQQSLSVEVVERENWKIGFTK